MPSPANSPSSSEAHCQKRQDTKRVSVEDHEQDVRSAAAEREALLDETLAQSFPASDPLSSLYAG